MPTSDSLRNQDFCEVAYVLFIDGINYAWVTDHGPGNGLAGGGTSHWIYAHETANAWEEPGQRSVLNGLRLPSKLPGAMLDTKFTGMLGTTTASFDLLDLDGLLPQLFASEGKDGRRIATRVGPGTTALGASIDIEGDTTINPRGKWIGTEAIGVSGQRRAYFPLPIQGIGLEHPGGFQVASHLPRPPLVTDEPVDFEGRLVTVFRLHRDHLSSTDTWTSWTTWADAFVSGDMVFVGRLRGTGEYAGDYVWKINCDGVESLLKRQLGALSQHDLLQISQSAITLSDSERRIIVEGMARDEVGPTFETTYYSASHLNTGALYLLPASGSKADYVAAVRSVGKAILGGDPPTPLAGQYNTGTYWVDSVDTNPLNRGFKFEVSDQGMSVSRHRRAISSDEAMAVVSIGLHRKVWKYLGYDPQLQDSGNPQNDLQARFTFLAAGEYFGQGAIHSSTSGVNGAPVGGYSVVTINTRSREPGSLNYDNDGQPMHFKPLYPSGLLTLETGGVFSVTESNTDNLYITPDPLSIWFSTSSTSAGDCNASRKFVFRGKRATEPVSNDIDIEDVEGEDFVAVARCAWNTTQYGKANGATNPEFAIEEWIDPRLYGFDFPKLGFSADWAGSAEKDSEYAIHAAPINSFAFSDFDYAEPVWMVLRTLMCSTGTSEGYDGAVEAFTEPPIQFQFGDNQEGETGLYRRFSRDTLEADMGLAIPFQLLETPTQFAAAFSEFDGGDAGNFCRGRYGYVGAFASDRVIESIVATRGMMLTWKGNRFGVARLEKFPPAQADVAITQDDLYGDPSDPRSVVPHIEFRATGPIDKVEMEYRADAIDGALQANRTIQARDEGARSRKGNSVIQISDDGLVPVEWYVQGGGGDPPNIAWTQEAGDYWGIDRATFFAKRHYTARLRICKQTGQDLGLGTKVRLTNPWVPTPSGQMGIVDGTGIVIANDLIIGRSGSSDGEYYDTTILLFADGMVAQRYFMPMGRVSLFSGSTVTLREDMFGVATGTTDAARFARPSVPASLTGDLGVHLLSYDRTTWTLRSELRTVSSVSGNVVTLNSAFTDYNPYHLNFLVAVAYDDQTAANWAQTLGIVVVDDTLEFGAGPTAGFRLVDQ